MSTPPSIITLADIAQRARVSRTTVSLALRNSPRISESVRQRVQAIARQLDYRQNPLVTAHMSYVRTLHPRYTGQCIAFVCIRSLAVTRFAQRGQGATCNESARLFTVPVARCTLTRMALR